MPAARQPHRCEHDHGNPQNWEQGPDWHSRPDWATIWCKHCKAFIGHSDKQQRQKQQAKQQGLKDDH